MKQPETILQKPVITNVLKA